MDHEVIDCAKLLTRILQITEDPVLGRYPNYQIQAIRELLVKPKSEP